MGSAGITGAVTKKSYSITSTVALFFPPLQRQIFSLAAPNPLIPEPAAPCLLQTQLPAHSAPIPVSEGFVSLELGLCAVSALPHRAALFSGTLSTWGA